MSKGSPHEEDLTGQSRLARNVAFAWGGYLVHLVAGFVMPRLISDRLGQTTLGIWDFSWSVVSYFGLVQLGLGASVQRYVPRYRAVGDWEGLSTSVSTVGLFLKGASLLVAVITVVCSWWILPLFGNKLGTELDASRWAVLFLGGEIAFSLAFTVYGGVIVGCHRWDIQNTISAFSYAGITVGMIVALFMGGGLPALALTHFLATAAGDVTRWKMVRRLCPELVVSARRASWPNWLEQARFSAKSLVPRIAALLSNQALSIVITLSLGPAMLAIYSRPRSLVRQVQVLAAKYGSVLIPTASSLQAKADATTLHRTFRASAYYISCLFMPLLVTLAILGDSLIRLWMGPAYVFPGLSTVLALGSFPSWVQEPVWSILTGMNQHGKVALTRLMGAACSVALLAIGMGLFHWGLLGAALAFAVPQAVVDGVITPRMACRRVGVSLRQYYMQTFLKPGLCVLPYACCLWVARLTWQESVGISVAAGSLGAVLLAGTYWRMILPAKLKRKVRARFFPASVPV